MCQRRKALIAFHYLKADKSRASGRTGGAPPAENLWRPDVKALVSGWFSFEQTGASAGDLLARDVACEWLRDAGRAFDVALAPPFTGGVDWRAVDPAAYSEVVFVCGPFGDGAPPPAVLTPLAPPP